MFSDARRNESLLRAYTKFGNSQPLSEFLQVTGDLTLSEWGQVIDQALILVDDLAASAATGYLELDGDDGIVISLVYSMELARSVDLGHPTALPVSQEIVAQVLATFLDDNQLNDVEVEVTDVIFEGDDLQNVNVAFEEPQFPHHPKTRSGELGQTHVVAAPIYGLVNVHTESDRIVRASLTEKK